MVETAKNTTAARGPWPRRQDESVYEFTRERQLLRQYCEMYQRECRIVDDPDFLAAEEDYNRDAHILIARIGSECIGGGRLSIRSTEQTKPLPIEIADFRLENCFPGLKRPGMRYGEVSRLVLRPEFRDGRASLEMWKQFGQKIIDLDLAVTYAAAPLINLRAYRKHCRSLGAEVKIHMDVELPPYPGFEQVTDYLLSCVVPEAAAARQPNGAHAGVAD